MLFHTEIEEQKTYKVKFTMQKRSEVDLGDQCAKIHIEGFDGETAILRSSPQVFDVDGWDRLAELAAEVARALRLSQQTFKSFIEASDAEDEFNGPGPWGDGWDS